MIFYSKFQDQIKWKIRSKVEPVARDPEFPEYLDSNEFHTCGQTSLSKWSVEIKPEAPHICLFFICADLLVRRLNNGKTLRKWRSELVFLFHRIFIVANALI